MEPELAGTRRTQVLFYAAAYGALVAAVALAAAIGTVWHGGLLNLYLLLRLNRWAFSLYGNVVTLVLVLGWLVLAVVLEHRFSHARGLPALRRAAGRILIAEAVLLAASLVVFWLLVPEPIV